MSLSTDTGQRKMEDPFDKFIDILEASRILKIHPESVRRLIRRQELPGYKYANKWLIRKDALEEFARTYDGRQGARSSPAKKHR